MPPPTDQEIFPNILCFLCNIDAHSQREQRTSYQTKSICLGWILDILHCKIPYLYLSLKLDIHEQNQFLLVIVIQHYFVYFQEIIEISTLCHLPTFKCFKISNYTCGLPCRNGVPVLQIFFLSG